LLSNLNPSTNHEHLRTSAEQCDGPQYGAIPERLSEPAFEHLSGAEEQYRAVVVASRWPDGFTCPVCGGPEHSQVKSRGLFQCTACRRQTSPIAGTILASTKLPMRTRFRAMYRPIRGRLGACSNNGQFNEIWDFVAQARLALFICDHLNGVGIPNRADRLLWPITRAGS
jgi:hypothetical protein